MRYLATAAAAALALIAACNLMPYFDEAPECVEGETRERAEGCGPCSEGTAHEVCSPGRLWVLDFCAEDPSDADGDGFANRECEPGVQLDCNDGDPTVFPGATGVEGCSTGDTEPCTTSCGTAGTRFCTSACLWAPCEPPHEDCTNDVDDDCDGATDEVDPPSCTPGELTDCVTECGTAGRGVCTSLCGPPPVSMCEPPSESCDEEDNDCDGLTDEDFPCRAGTATPCVTVCGSTGNGTCSGSCTLPPVEECAFAEETCNGWDDDCDGEADEGDGLCPGYVRGTQAGRTYLFSTSPTPWPAAQAACSSRGYHLASVGDAAEDEWIRTTARAHDPTGTYWWIGGFQTDGEYCTEPRECWEWDDGSGALSETWGAGWRSGEPNDGGAGEDCLATSIAAAAETGWADAICLESYRHVCEQECAARSREGRPYLFCNAPRTWEDARDACAARGYYLVTIDDVLEDLWVITTARALSDLPWWIGLNDRESEGGFVWVEGASEYRDWASGQPDNSSGSEDCVQTLWPSGLATWNDARCTNRHAYVCEWGQGS